ncbi:hypothetical protein NQ317_002648, partial [Molorchus minor]
NAETLLHLLKGSLGTGILAMPMAFYHSGYILGVIATACIGVLCTYCIHMLIKCEYELCKRRKVGSLTYPATAECALMEGPSFFQGLAPYAVIGPNAERTFCKKEGPRRGPTAPRSPGLQPL